nr:protein FAM149 [Hymenolepis microstoma]
MPASSISRMPPPLTHLPNTQDWLSLYSSLSSTVDFNDIKQNPCAAIKTASSPVSSPLSMMFKNKPHKPNLIKDEQDGPKEPSNLIISNRDSGDGYKVNKFSSDRSTLPLPLTVHDKYYDLNSLSSEDFSFTTNTNDVTSITSSDWGDEACEIDRQKSHHLKQLFNAIDQLLFEPGCLKNFISNTEADNQQSSAQPTSSGLMLVRNLLPECEEWASKFPHFRLRGLQIHPPQPSPLLTKQQKTLYQQYLQNRSLGHQPEVSKRFTKSSDANALPRLQADLTVGQQLTSSLMVQGQKIPIPNTSWLPQTRMNRRAPKTRISSMNTWIPSNLANHTRGNLSTLHEDTGLETTRSMNKLTSPLRSTSQWTNSNVRVKSLHRGEGMGTRVTKHHESPTNKELLSETLVEMLLNEALAALEKSTSNTKPTLDGSQIAVANLSTHLSNLSPREIESEGKTTRLSMTPDQHISAKTTPPLISRNRSPEPRESLTLSGKSFYFQKNSAISSFSSLALKNASRDAKFSITWPLRPDIGRSSDSRLNSSQISPTNCRHVNTRVSEKKRPQTNSALPPIVLSRTAPSTFGPQQRRRLGGNEVTRLPSIYSSNSEQNKSIHHSAKLTLYHRGSGNQTTLVQHSSTLPQSEISNPRPKVFVAKYPPYSSRGTKIQYSMGISTDQQILFRR